jgi:hypothetical protein
MFWIGFHLVEDGYTSFPTKIINSFLLFPKLDCEEGD